MPEDDIQKYETLIGRFTEVIGKLLKDSTFFADYFGALKLDSGDSDKIAETLNQFVQMGYIAHNHAVAADSIFKNIVICCLLLEEEYKKAETPGSEEKMAELKKTISEIEPLIKANLNIYSKFKEMDVEKVMQQILGEKGGQN